MTNKEQKVAEILNGEKNVELRCAVELGYNAGYRAAIDDVRSKAHGIISRMVKQEMPYAEKRRAQGLSFDIVGMVTIFDAEINNLEA